MAKSVNQYLISEICNFNKPKDPVVQRCPNCGEADVAHFVPPGLGDEGFFMCERKIDAPTE